MAVTKQDVKRLASEAGFDLVRVTTADPFVDWQRAIKERIALGLIPPSSMQEEEPFRQPDDWADPARNLEGARSVVVVGMRYLVRPFEHDPDERVLRGRFARQNWRDTYGDLYARRDRLVDRLSQLGARCAKKPCLPNKSAMARSGMGSYGMNGVIQTREHGSWVLATTVATDVVLEPDAHVEPTCDGCRACIDACPTGAIVRPYVVDVARCLTHVLAVAGPIPRDLRPGVGDRINGCDACQEACAMNRSVEPRADDLTNPRREWTERPALMQLLSLSDKEFKHAFHDLELARPEILQRNALVALGNLKDPSAVPQLARVLKGPDAMLRAHAAWALGSIGGTAARRALKDADRVEDDATVLEEIDEASQ
jgi:epoxyqueuosine reductase